MEIKLEVLLNNLSKRVSLLESSSHPPIDWNKNIAALYERLNELELIIEEIFNDQEIPGEEIETMPDVQDIQSEN